MSSPFIIVTPSHRLDTQLAIAAVRAGETGIVNLGYGDDPVPFAAPLNALRRHTRVDARWGLRWDTLGDAARSPACLRELVTDSQCPMIIVAGFGEEIRAGGKALKALVQQSRQIAKRVLLEVCGTAEALVAQDAGCDGLVIKGHEAGGRVGDESTFLLLQQLQGRLNVPYWIQGGIGPDTAAAAFLAGASGVVLGEQMWLAAESPFDSAERRQWAQLDGSETICVGPGGQQFRFFCRSGAQAAHELQQALASGTQWPDWLRRRMIDPNSDHGKDLRIPVGQEIAFARRLAEEHVNVAGILEAFRKQVRINLDGAARAQALAADGALARTHRTRYPILQGPMTRVSDTAEFATAVAEAGALPFLALALMTGPEVNALLTETQRRLGERPWGVGILGFVPAELRKAQLAEVCRFRPTHAIIAGGRPSQARQLEEQGVSTYLHVPSPSLLESFIQDGARKFIFEGRECGGHVGPRSSFALWQSAVDVLRRVEPERAEEFQIVFAGGIHDRLSAALVAAAAEPLTSRGMKFGVLMGTAYLFTREAVQTGAILAEFQRQALACQETVLLESGIGHATRCVRTPFADEFNQARAELILAGKSADEVRQELEVLNVGRLRIASKGLVRQSDPRGPDAKSELVAAPEDVQRCQGLYMIGQVAGLRNEVVSLADLHADVSEGNLTVLEGAARKLLPWQETVARQKRATTEIAIVGMACRFPRARDLRRYWENICNRLDAIQEVPPERWRIEDFFCDDRQARDRIYSKWGAFLEPILFDPVKWRIPPASLRQIEPMQLLSLEVASKAMEDAGYHRRAIPRERAGVLFAVPGSHEFGSAYCFRTMMRHYLPQVKGLLPEIREEIYASIESQLPEWTEDSFAGYLGNVIAGRIARELDFHGPNFTVDAACAASLAAVFTAVEQLRSGTADLMLVGGTDGTNNPFGYMSFARTQALSPRGRSRPFDDSGDGIALGEGIACIVMKRLPDAERDGDKIYAIIKGVGASSDGKNRSLTAPFPPGQIRAVTRAFEDAGVSPGTASLIEAHGTGTSAGDDAELTTLTQVFSAHTQQRQCVAVGSVKSMIGHTKTLAGLAGMVKTALALKHRVLPPTLGVEKPSTRVDFANSPLYLNTATRPWIEEHGDHPRRAGVSSFGFGGTNFHVVLEEYTGDYVPDMESDLTPRSAEWIVLRRASRDGLVRDLRALDEQLGSTATDDLAGLAGAIFTDESGRSADASNCRLAIVAHSVADLRQKIQKALALLPERSELNDPSGIYASEAPPTCESEVCFLYPGQGSQALNMLRELVVGYSWSRTLFRQANCLLAETLPQPLSRYLYPPPAFTDAERAEQAAALNDTRVAQPALGLVELFATDLFDRFGIRPARVAGHSYGEHVALNRAGCLSREDLLRLSAFRGQTCAEVAQTCPGAMAAVQAGADATATALEELKIDARLANLNAPDQTVIAGRVEAIEAAVVQLPRRGLRTRRIPVSAAFHTALLSPVSEALDNFLRGLQFERPQLPVYSNTTGGLHADDPQEIRRMLARHFSEPVLFEKQVRQMHADGGRIFIEVGPGKVLTDLVSRTLKDLPARALALDMPGGDGWTQLGHVLARLSVLGLPVQLDAWFHGRDLTREKLKEFLARVKAESTPKPTDWLLSPNKAEPVTPLPGRKLESSGAAEHAPGRNGTHKRAPEQKTFAEGAVAAAQTKPAPTKSAPTQPAAPVVEPSLSQISVSSLHARMTVDSNLKREEATIAMSIAKHDHAVNGSAHTEASCSHDAFGQFHATTRALLQAQQAQNEVLERFLETQERILLYAKHGVAAAGGGAVEGPRLAVATAPGLPVSLLSSPSAGAGRGSAGARPPVPLIGPLSARLTEPVSVPQEGRAGVQPPAAPTSPSSRPQDAVKHTPPAHVSISNGSHETEGPPSTEQFRKELLDVVSTRTGYPTDALDETLQLESALGIDSIKTVEIFNNLKRYHEYFRAEGQEEEELLAEFSKFKTLRDIINAYDRRRQPTGAAKRFAVAAVPAPAELEDAKKNSVMEASAS